MKKKVLLVLILITATHFLGQAQNLKAKSLYKNSKMSIEQRVKDLLGKMTIEEKAGQLNQLNGGAFTGPAANDMGQQSKLEMVKKGMVGSMLNVIGAKETRAAQKVAVEQSRLGIPLLFGYDVIHGYKTIFPIPLAEACSWDMAGIESNSSIAAREAASAGIHWTFGPMCDITNDPRWGRIMEGVGEDPYYGYKVTEARVKGLQGKLDDTAHILACVKHFAVYGAVESGREYNQVDVSRVMLWNKYLPPYKGGIDAGAATVMNSFNVFEGVPTSANKYLVTDILKNHWGFKGFLVSDWNSFGEMITHGYAEDRKDAALKAFKAGSMMDMETRVMIEYIPVLIKEGKITVQQLDDAVGRILYYKFKLGLFDDPYKFSSEERESKTLFTEANRLKAREAAKQSIILLKNDNQVLPLKTSQKIALIGFFARSKEDMFDFWTAQGKSEDAVSIEEGLKNKFSHISYSKGYNSDYTTSEDLIKEAVDNAAGADVIVVNVGLSGKMAGEDRALADPSIPQAQLQLLQALQKTGKPIVALVTCGRPLIMTKMQGLANSILQCWILGTETGNAITDVLTGEYNPSAKTVITFPYAVGQIPIYYNHFNTGRPDPTDDAGNWFSRYRDIPNDPLYPFGYGLSYTTFNYSDFHLNDTVIKIGEPLRVSVTVTNTGKYDGEEVVQLYIRDIAASIIRPVKELKGFEKIFLKSGTSKTVNFILTDKELSFYDAEGKTVIEKGKFKVFVGGDSKKVLEHNFELK